MENSENYTYVFSDIETDTVKAHKLLQIAAVTDKGQQFCVYVNPQTDLPQSCTDFNGFYYNNNKLYRNGRPLPSKTIVKALNQFMFWIRNLQGKVVLVFHNGFAFDCVILAKFLVKHNIDIPSNLVRVADTLQQFRQHLKPPVIENHKLSTVAKHFNIPLELAHDALHDSIALKQVCEKLVNKENISFDILFADSKMFDYYLKRFKS